MPRRHLITERDVLRARQQGIPSLPAHGALVTPAARDAAARWGIALDIGALSGGRNTTISATSPAPAVSDAARTPSSQSSPRLTWRVVVGADHGGVAMKDSILAYLRDRGAAVQDVGTYSAEAVDYPDFATAVARVVAAGAADFGVMIDGAGIGSCMAANKVPGIRAAMCYDVTTAANAREHNNANLLTLGGTLIGLRLAQEIVRTFLETPFGGGRHARRVEKIDALDAPRR